MVIWLVGMKSMESLSPKVTMKFHQFPTKNVQVMAFFKFSPRNFRVGWAGLQNISRTINKFLNLMRGREYDLHTKFQPNRTKISKVIPFSIFLGGRLVGPVRINQFWKKFLALKRIYYLGILSVQKIKALAQRILKIYHF